MLKTFAEHFAEFAGTPEELIQNRPQRVEISQELANCTREEGVLLDAAYTGVIHDTYRVVGTAIDKLPQHLKSYGVLFLVFAAAEAMRSLEEITFNTSLVGKITNSTRPVVVNPREPNCSCSNCQLIRDLDRTFRPEAYHGAA